MEVDVMKEDIVTPGGHDIRLHISRKYKALHKPKGKIGFKHKQWSFLPRHIPTPDRAQRGRMMKELHHPKKEGE